MKTAKEWLKDGLIIEDPDIFAEVIEAIQSDALESAAKYADDYAKDRVCDCASAIGILIRELKPE